MEQMSLSMLVPVLSQVPIDPSLEYIALSFGQLYLECFVPEIFPRVKRRP